MATSFNLGRKILSEDIFQLLCEHEIIAIGDSVSFNRVRQSTGYKYYAYPEKFHKPDNYPCVLCCLLAVFKFFFPVRDLSFKASTFGILWIISESHFSSLFRLQRSRPVSSERSWTQNFSPALARSFLLAGYTAWRSQCRGKFDHQY